MIDYNQDVFDYLSITIHNERMPFMSVIEIFYDEEYNDELVYGGVGNPMLAHRPVGTARGRFKGEFRMKMQKPTFDLLKTFYAYERRGILTIEPTKLIVTFSDKYGIPITEEVVTVVFRKVTPSNMNNDGGKAIEVEISGHQVAEPFCMTNGIPTNGLPII